METQKRLNTDKSTKTLVVNVCGTHAVHAKHLWDGASGAEYYCPGKVVAGPTIPREF